MCDNCPLCEILSPQPVHGCLAIKVKQLEKALAAAEEELALARQVLRFHQFSDRVRQSKSSVSGPVTPVSIDSSIRDSESSIVSSI